METLSGKEVINKINENSSLVIEEIIYYETVELIKEEGKRSLKLINI